MELISKLKFFQIFFLNIVLLECSSQITTIKFYNMCNENQIMSKRILVVEDEEILRVGTTLHLKSFGYDVVGNFQRGEDAVEHVTDLNPDLILMDIKLSGKLDGIETVKQIQKKIDVPVIYLSAYSNDKLIEGQYQQIHSDTL